MYDSLNSVYHSSKRETFNYIKAECEQTGTKYFGLDENDPNATYLDRKEILELWKEALELQNGCPTQKIFTNNIRVN